MYLLYRLILLTIPSHLSLVCLSVQIPGTVVEPGGDKTPGVVEMVFYCSCGLGALLHLPVILAVLFSRYEHCH